VRKPKKVKKASEIMLQMPPTLIPISTVVISSYSRCFTSPYLLDCDESCFCLSTFIAHLSALAPGKVAVREGSVLN
jgi:hypothetical protein